MKRIDTTTVEANKHGPGRDGYTDGDPVGGVPPTRLNAAQFDHFQEEIARAIELEDTVLDDSTFDQLGEVIRGQARDIISPREGFVASGLQWTLDSGLDANLSVGVFYADGVRRTVTTIDGADTPRTFADASTRYVYIEADPADPEAYVIVDSATQDHQPGRALTAVITTAGGVITNISNWNNSSPGAGIVSTAPLMRSEGMLPAPGVATSIGTLFTQPDGTNGRFDSAAVEELRVGETNSDGVSTRDLHVFIDRESVSGVATNDNIILLPSGWNNDDTATLKVEVSGRRTDAAGFAYSALVIVGAGVTAGSFVLGGAQTVIHEAGDGGGTRTVRFIVDGSGRIALRYDVTAAESWVFTSVVRIISNQS